MRVDQVTNLEGFLPFEEFFGLGLELCYFDRPPVKIPIRRLDIVDKLEVQGIPVDLTHKCLGPPTVPEVCLLSDGIHHITYLEVATPFLVLVSQSLELLLWYLVVVEIQNGVVCEEMLNALVECALMLTRSKHCQEQGHVVFMDACDYI
jgi:hypothetical protein